MTRFRITTWPQEPLPRPAVRLRPPRFRLGDDAVLVPAADDLAPVDRRAQSRATEVEAAGEVYLQVAQLDLDDPEAVVDLVSRFGTLGVRHRGFAAFDRVPWFREVRPRLERAWPYEDRGVMLHLAESLDDFRFGASSIRDMTQAWRILQGEDIASPWASLPPGWALFDSETVEQYRRSGREPDREDEARHVLQTLLPPALVPFQPSLLIAPGGEKTLKELPGITPVDFWSGVPLYNLCCLELFNHIAANATYRTCQNEACGDIFVRQRGRAEHGQHRVSGGVKYCSAACARSQAVRMHRRRQRASAGEMSSRVPTRKTDDLT